jgi:hypothetical protein
MRGILGALWLMGVVACSNDGGTAPPPGGTFKPGIQLAGTIQALQAGTMSTSFNFAHQQLVWVRLNLAQIDRVTTVQFKVISPRGNLMYEADIPYSADAQVTTTMLPDIDHPVTVQRAKSATGGFHLDYPIAIAGSSFTKYPEPGAWQVIAHVTNTDQTFTAPMDVTVVQ